MTPAHKLAIVSVLKRTGEIVAVTGDGVNDAPALKKADIGVAMGMAGTEVAKEASDVVLLDDNFASIVAGIEEGRAVYANIKKFLSYILTSNVPEVVPYLAYAIFSIPLPLTVIQILAVDLGTDMLPALALGREKPEPDVMRRPPRPRTERLLSWPLLGRAYLLLGPVEAAAGLAGYFWVLSAGGWKWGTPLAPSDPLYMQATTMCLTAIVVTQVANGLTSRKRDNAGPADRAPGEQTAPVGDRERGGASSGDRLSSVLERRLRDAPDSARGVAAPGSVRRFSPCLERGAEGDRLPRRVRVASKALPGFVWGPRYLAGCRSRHRRDHPTLASPPLQGGGDVFIGPLPHQGECFIGRLPPSLMEDRRSRLNLSSPLAGRIKVGGGTGRGTKQQHFGATHTKVGRTALKGRMHAEVPPVWK